MRNLMLVLIAFIAVVSFIRAYDGPQPGAGKPGLATEAPVLEQ